VHAGVAGYAFDSRLCLRCHADSQVDRVADHGPFLIRPGVKHDGDRANCLECHPVLRADKPFGADFTVPECLGCHGRADTDERHAGRTGYRYATAACLECHPTGND
jgi:hypothetical protein